MEQNVSTLSSAEKKLEEIQVRARAAAQILDRLAAALELSNKLGGGGFFGNYLLLNQFDAMQLSSNVRTIATDANNKLEEVGAFSLKKGNA